MTVTSRIILLCAVVAAVVAVAFFAMVDPVQCNWAPKCLFHTLTGLQCPGCGFSRAMHALLHGRLSEALSYNYFMVLSVPYALAVMLATYCPALPVAVRYNRYITGRVAVYTYIALFCIWWIVRNLLGI